MNILDTNVLSELMKQSPSLVVVERLKRLDPAESFITSITVAELRLGVVSLPSGTRRDKLAAKLMRVNKNFAERTLPFDHAAAELYADLVASRRRAGRPISIPDAQIAAIALSRNATLVTRNTRDFELCQLSLLNPWEQALPA